MMLHFLVKLFFIVLLLLVFSCSDKDVKPFVGQKIFIHKSSNFKASRNFDVKIDRVVGNNYWIQKGGYDTHSIPNLNLKFPLNKVIVKEIAHVREM